ncbi:MAG: hypothetical protein JO190_11630 [Candidatus Eremiobacteraeota bacterium]|nr:hypothetical protein [Candidatus Eremiobacteraeota bacterium]MBV8498481.1 hypothetical protein [Candidatus Eremiobacteraeota bacterium]
MCRVNAGFSAAIAAVIAVGTAACSGERAMVPGLSQQTLETLERSHAGRFAPIGRQPPVGMAMEWLLTDGSVLAQSGATWSSWYRYVPDAKGSYSDGTWSQVASLQSGYGPLYFAADVLADGRLAISGGEYNTPGNGYDLQLTNQGAVYDPVKNAWTPLRHPARWKYIGDSPSSVLPNGNMLVGDKLHTWDAALNPKTLAWRRLGDKGKSDFNAEEGWTLLPNGTILTADVKKAPNSEIYNPKTGTWTSAGSTIVDLHSPSPYGCLMYGPNLCYYPPGEIGPAILRPDGTVFYTGSYSKSGPGHTAIYNTASGTWSVGPDFPNGDNAGDSYATLEPSGNVLVFGVSGIVYEWNGSALSQVNGITYAGPPLLLPTGQVMVLGYSSVGLYTPSGQPQSSWLPTIKSVQKTLTRGQTYKISGTQFNGFGQAMSYGDENQNATNYPLVRITNNASGNVFYARTHDHSTMAVATGSLPVSTNFDVPAQMDTGASTLVVIANGIASKPVTVTIK